MKKLALAIVSLTIAAAPVLACPHMDQAAEEAAPPRTAEKKDAPKAEKTADKKEATPTKEAAKPAEKKAPEKKADKVSQR